MDVSVLLDIWSDAICPWCYIGKRRLDASLAARRDPPDRLRWYPFQLYPQIPSEGMTREAFQRLRFGDDTAQRRAAYENIEAEGEAAGIRFDFAAIGRMPNTFDAHRLAEFATQTDSQETLIEALFRRYFCDGEDIGDQDVLVAAALEAGMDGDDARTLLRSDGLEREVRHAVSVAYQSGVKGVPYLVINEQFPLQGAQSADTLGHYFDRAERIGAG